MADMNTIYSGSDKNPLSTGSLRRKYAVPKKKKKKKKKGSRKGTTKYKAGI